MRAAPLLWPPGEVWRYWVGLLVPPTAWGARLLAGWALAEAACAHGYAGSSGYLVWQTALIVATAGVTVWSGWVAFVVWRGSAGGSELDPVDVRSFLALTGVLSAVIFLLLILVEGSAVYVVGC